MDVSRILELSYLLSSESDSDCAAEDEEILCMLELSNQVKGHNRYSDRVKHGEWTMASEFSDEVFMNRFRLSRKQFSEVHKMIEPAICMSGCNARQPIGTEEKLAVFLRFITSGENYMTIAEDYRLGHSTVSKIVREVSAMIWKVMQPIYLPDTTKKTWKSISQKFEMKTNFPHCVGVVGARNIIVGKPGTNGTFYSKYKNTFSAALIVIVDPDYKFTSIDVEDIGRFRTRGLLRSGALGRKISKRSHQLPKANNLNVTTEPLPYVFLGDGTTPLSESLLKPYPEKELKNGDFQVFNERIGEAQKIADNAFSLLASEFQVFRRPFENKMETVKNIIKASCVLHNFLRCTSMDTDITINIQGAPETQLLPMKINNSRYSEKALKVRELFTKYFIDTNAVT